MSACRCGREGWCEGCGFAAKQAHDAALDREAGTADALNECQEKRYATQKLKEAAERECEELREQARQDYRRINQLEQALWNSHPGAAEIRVGGVPIAREDVPPRERVGDA